jgi:hypothetical protein
MANCARHGLLLVWLLCIAALGAAESDARRESAFNLADLATATLGEIKDDPFTKTRICVGGTRRQAANNILKLDVSVHHIISRKSLDSLYRTWTANACKTSANHPDIMKAVLRGLNLVYSSYVQVSNYYATYEEKNPPFVSPPIVSNWTDRGLVQRALERTWQVFLWCGGNTMAGVHVSLRKESKPPSSPWNDLTEAQPKFQENYDFSIVDRMKRMCRKKLAKIADSLDDVAKLIFQSYGKLDQKDVIKDLSQICQPGVVEAVFKHCSKYMMPLEHYIDEKSTGTHLIYGAGLRDFWCNSNNTAQCALFNSFAFAARKLFECASSSSQANLHGKELVQKVELRVGES